MNQQINSLIPNDPSQADKSVVALMYGLKQKESSGNYNAIGDKGTAAGVGQWSNQINGKPTALGKGQIPANFTNSAKQYGLNPTDFSPENQNKVLYAEIASGKQKGLTPEQILSAHNSGDPNKYKRSDAVGSGSVGGYDVATYVKDAMGYAQQYAQKSNPQNKTGQQVSPDQTQSVSDPNGPSFAYKEGDSAGTAGLKALGNLPGSAYNFGKGVVNSVNPLNTLDTAGKIGTGFADLQDQKGTAGAIWDIIKGLPKAAYDTLVPQGVKSILGGDLQGATKAFTNDPFGQVAPLVLGAKGLAEGIDSASAGSTLGKSIGDTVTKGKPTAYKGTDLSGAMDTAMNKVSGAVTKPLGAIIGKPLSMAGTLGTSVLSHLTGLDPSTMKAIISDPTSFSKLAQEATSRSSVAEDFGKSLDQLASDKAETGSLYQGIRNDATPVSVPPDFIPSVLDKFGLKLKDGEISADTNSVTRNTSDIKALQKFVDDWGNKNTLTPHGFLNMRSDLADLANYDKLTGIGKTKTSSVISDQLRQKANEVLRPQIKGLKELDTEASPQIQMYKQAKKDFLNNDGTFKDGAINKIANAKGLGKEKLLSRMETISPGITKSLQVLKAVEDIQKANGLKVGNYTRSLIEGGGLLTGNIPVIISAILTHPSIAVQILRGFGYVGKGVIPIVSALQTIAGDVNKGNLPSFGKKGIEADSSITKDNPISNSLDSNIKSKPTQSEPNQNSQGGSFNSHPTILPRSLRSSNVGEIGQDMANRRGILGDFKTLQQRRANVTFPKRIRELNKK